MSSTSEKGHAKNVANFTDLTNICAGYGAKYNPSRSELKMPFLQLVLTKAELSQEKLNKLTPFYTTAVAEKDAEFSTINKRTTRVMSAFKSSKPLAGELASAQTIARKIKGEGTKKSKSTKAAPAGEGQPAATEKAPISTAQLSMDMRIENLKRLTEVVGANSKYAPNETDLQVTSLNIFATRLKTLSETVVVKQQPVDDARAERNEALYHPETGLVSIGDDVKDYIKSVFGATSPEYRRAAKITFTKLKS
jgi:hypothetical protein